MRRGASALATRAAGVDRIGGWILLLAAALLLAGCGGPTVPASFYRLGSLPPSEPAAGDIVSSASPLLLVGPVNVPDYLDRPQLVTRSGAYELSVDEFHRWGGSLREELSLALVENLASLLGPGVVGAYGDSTSFDDVLQLRVDLQRLEGTPGGAVELLARWTLLEDGGRRPRMTRRSRIHVPMTGTGAEAVVAAYSEAVVAFSREIAGALGGSLH